MDPETGINGVMTGAPPLVGEDVPSRAHSDKVALRRALLLIASFMVVEATAGILTGSLVLLSDAGHMLTDTVALGMALAAVIAAGRASGEGQKTFGLYRLEILAALANATLLGGVAIYVIAEALRRFGDPPDVAGGTIVFVAAGALAVNIIAWRLLRLRRNASLNLQAAYLEVMTDLVASAGALVAGLLIRFAGWHAADPVFGIAIGLFILPRAWRLGRRALAILVQAAPPHVDVGELRRSLNALDGVVDVHDLHVWTLTSQMDVASAHLVVTSVEHSHSVLDEAQRILRDEYSVSHATVQVEPEDHAECSEVSW